MESSRLREVMKSMFFALGKAEGDDYTIADQALGIFFFILFESFEIKRKTKWKIFSDVLREIHCKLVCEDQTLRTFRRAIGSGQHIKNDLIPFLIHAKDQQLIEMIIRVLGVLTIPTESLFSVEVMMRTKIGRQTLSDVKMLLIESKESFTDARATRVIIDHMKNILEKGTNLTTEQCEQINDCLFLIRNILHIPEREINENEGQIKQIPLRNKIIWHLFMVNIDKILIYLMSCAQREYWSVIMVQLIAVMFKDQQPSNLLKLLNTCLQDALSDSTDDFESNTTIKDNSVESSPIVTSDQTSDSSDNGGEYFLSSYQPDEVHLSASTGNVKNANEITNANDDANKSPTENQEISVKQTAPISNNPDSNQTDDKSNPIQNNIISVRFISIISIIHKNEMEEIFFRHDKKQPPINLKRPAQMLQ